MAVRLGIDFGTSNTVLALWDESRRDVETLRLPSYGSAYDQAGQRIWIVPSVIHYAADGASWIGDQVIQRNLYSSAQTFRWMKQHIARENPNQKAIGSRRIDARQAGAEFLTTVLTVARDQAGLTDEEVAFTLPVESFERYEDWLAGVAENAGLTRYRLIDESSAAALGYAANIQPNDAYLIFDFGAGTLDVSVVQIDEESTSVTGRRCRTLGKAGKDLGGNAIDMWLYQELLKRNQRSPADEDVRKVSNYLLAECEAAKIRLSSEMTSSVTHVDPDSGAALGANFTRTELEALFDQHELFTEIDATLRRAIRSATERGFDDQAIKSVMMLGGTSLIPSVQATVRRIFGRDRVRLERPLDAVARGAAVFAAGMDFYDHIQHDYAIRSTNMTSGIEDYRVIVKRGTPYPTPAEALPSMRMRVRATHDGQARLGIDIFELGDRRARPASAPVELTFDPSGAARVRNVTPDDEDRRSRHWMNESARTFLDAESPVRQGEDRYEVEFSVDGNKRLLLTAKDLRFGRVVMRNQVVIRLT